MANLKQKLTKQINLDFKNLTKNVLNQKESNLCVPITVSVLLRWALKNDLRVEDWKMVTLEIIFTTLVMIIYPRSLAGFNLNPKKEEQEFQENEIELLLKRMKFKTYLNESGWVMIRKFGDQVKGDFDFEQGKYFLKNIQYFDKFNLHLRGWWSRIRPGFSKTSINSFSREILSFRMDR